MFKVPALLKKSKRSGEIFFRYGGHHKIFDPIVVLRITHGIGPLNIKRANTFMFALTILAFFRYATKE